MSFHGKSLCGYIDKMQVISYVGLFLPILHFYFCDTMFSAGLYPATEMKRLDTIPFMANPMSNTDSFKVIFTSGFFLEMK